MNSLLLLLILLALVVIFLFSINKNEYFDGGQEQTQAAQEDEGQASDQNSDQSTDNKFYPNADVVSNYQYESDLNDDKRRIRLIQRQYADQIVSEFRYAIKDS